MRTRNDVPDAELEGYLRTLLVDEAAHAPLPGDLAGGAVRAAQQHRRRTAAVTAALSVLVLVCGAAVVQQLGQTDSSAPPAGQSPSTSASAAPLVPGEAMLMFRGVEVPVPAKWLEPGTTRCGTAIADAAYVIDPSVPTLLCDATPPHPEVITEVVLQPVSTVEAGDRVAGETLLPDGRTRIASAIPQGDVWLSVTSPDADRARELMSGVLVVDRVQGCPVQPAPVPPTKDSTLVDFQLGARPGGVCGYRDGWLVGAEVLTTQEVAQVDDLLGAAPDMAVIDCARDDSSGPGNGWWLSLDGGHVWVDGSGQCRGTWSSNDLSRLVTHALVDAVGTLAAGPVTFGGRGP